MAVKQYFRFLTVFVVVFGYAFQPSKAQDENFAQAKFYFKLEKYSLALKTLTSLLEKRPNEEKVIVLAARTLLKLNRFRESVKYFRKVQLSELRSEEVYDYGLAFLTLRNYRRGLDAFERVPSGDALYDLAQFYGAVCAIKLREYALAESMLVRAEVLPDKLFESKTMYLKHLQEINQVLANPKKPTRSKSPREQKTRRPKDKKLKQKDEVITSPKEFSKARQTEFVPEVSRRFGFIGGLIQQGSDVRTNQDNEAANDTYEEAFAGLFADFGGQSVTRNPLGPGNILTGFQLEFKGIEREFTGTEKRDLAFETFEEAEQNMAISQGYDPESGETLLRISSRLWLDVPLAQSLAVRAEPIISASYPEIDGNLATGLRGVHGAIYGRDNKFHYKLSATYLDFVDLGQNTAVVNLVEGEFALGLEVWDLFAGLKLRTRDWLYLRFDEEQATVPDQIDSLEKDVVEIDGPDTTFSGRVWGNVKMGYGFDLSVEGGYQIIDSYFLYDPGCTACSDGKSLVAEGTNFFAQGFIKWQPNFPVSMLLRGEYQSYLWDVGEEVASVFNRRVASETFHIFLEGRVFYAF